MNATASSRSGAPRSRAMGSADSEVPARGTTKARRGAPELRSLHSASARAWKSMHMPAAASPRATARTAFEAPSLTHGELAAMRRSTSQPPAQPRSSSSGVGWSGSAAAAASSLWITRSQAVTIAPLRAGSATTTAPSSRPSARSRQLAIGPGGISAAVRSACTAMPKADRQAP